MKILISFGLLLMTLAVCAETTQLAFGDFASNMPSVKVKGAIEILHVQDENGERQLAVLKDFSLQGAVVMDLKICGDLESYPPFENICVSIGEPRNRPGKQVFRIRTPFINFKLAKIFDLDLGSDLAIAKILPLE